MHPIVRLFLICNIDGILSIIAFFGAYWLRLEIFPATPIVSTIIVFSCTIFSFILFGVYKRIWRYSSTDDLLIITKATLISVILAAFAFFLTTRLENMPRSTMLIYFILLTILSGGSRITYRLIRDKTLAPINNINERINVLLIGASDEAEALIRSSHKPDGPYHIIGIFDNDKILSQLNPEIVLIGLNFSVGFIHIPFQNFHGKGGGAYKIRYAVKDTPFWGAYMTDIIKDFPEIESGNVMKFLRKNKSLVDENIASFEKELIDIALVCKGSKNKSKLPTKKKIESMDIDDLESLVDDIIQREPGDYEYTVSGWAKPRLIDFIMKCQGIPKPRKRGSNLFVGGGWAL